MMAIVNDQGIHLPAPQPFRNLVAQARFGVQQADHEAFFRGMLQDIDEPTMPFGLQDIHRDGSDVNESHRRLPQSLNDRLRHQARRLGVSLASLCHLAWAQVIARTSGRQAVVFGTVLFGRMQAAAEKAIGLSINTLPFRFDIDGTDVETSVRLTHERLAKLLRHEHASLALAQQCSGLTGHTPLFTALLNYRHTHSEESTDASETSGAFDGIEWIGAKERTNYPFTLSVDDIGHALGLTAQVAEPFSSERLCAYMAQALDSLADALEHAPHTPVQGLEILPAEERTLLLATWNQTEASYPSERCLHQLVEDQVAKHPDAIAVVFEEQTLTYTQLNEQANQLAHHLIAGGIQPDDRVVICVERSLAMVVGLLGILKAGAAYVPLDPAYPIERLVQILADADPVACLLDRSGRLALGESIARYPNVWDFDQDRPRWATLPATNPSRDTLTSHHLAYVIYTSGSTGTPKGVMVEHRQVSRLFRVTEDLFKFDRDDIWCMAHSFAFDFSVWELWGALGHGARVVLASLDDVHSIESFHHLVCSHRVTVLNQTPSAFKAFSSVSANSLEKDQLRYIIFGGESLDPYTVRHWYATFPDRAVQLVNMYGITETTVHVTYGLLSPEQVKGAISPIGKRLADLAVYLLDRLGQPVPLGAVGELYIGGAGVARGYLNRPDLTAERFLRDPFSPKADARMYRTGDLARYTADGNLEFLGRNDHQVKIRGFRIELGEIEACLTEHPEVREAVVISREDTPGDKRLVAYVTTAADRDASSGKLAVSLRTHVSACLPDYMVPAAFVCLDSLPLTPNGKLDRKSLFAPDGDAYARHAYEPPQGKTEQTLAALWEDLLGVTQVSRHDNFFELGGHSLLAVRLLSRIPLSLGITLPLGALFAHPTLIALAQAITDTEDRPGVPSDSAMIPIARDGQLPLSFAQQRLWFLAQLDGLGGNYHIPMALRLHGALDANAWRRSLDTLFSRHEALRSVFPTTDGQPHVELLSSEHGLSLREYDLRYVPDAKDQLQRLCAEESSAPFDLMVGPLIRAVLIRVAEQEHVFLLTQHHIVSDGWSINVLGHELSTLYRAFSQRQSDPLPPLKIQYPDYAAWQRQWLAGERLQSQIEYWRHTLRDAPALLELPTDRPRPAQQSFAGASLPVQLDASLTQGLKRLGRQHGATLFMTLMTAWSAVLARLSGQDDLVIGTPTANRNRTEIEPLIGFFVNTLALRIDLSGEPSVAELLARVRRTALAAQDHQDLPFEQVVEMVQPPRRLDHTPLFQVMFSWQNYGEGTFELPGLRIEPAEMPAETVKFDMELTLGEIEGAVVGTLSYATALFDTATVERHRGYLLTLLHAMVVDAGQSMARVDLLASDERELLLTTWNQTSAPYPDRWCVHQLFEQQVHRVPDATAIVHEEQSLTYAQLNAQANRLAHQLIEQGVRPDSRIAISVERGITMVVGLLAILKAGGAYVPLDPAYPSGRLAQILIDAAPVMLLSDAAGRRALGHEALTHLTVLDLEAAPSAWAHQLDINPDLHASGLSAHHLAYIIYTSGSTGTPKGVMVEHRHLMNHITWQVKQFQFSECDAFLQRTSISFDASAWELWTPLSLGGRLVLLGEDKQRDIHSTLQEVIKQQVTIAQLVPSLLAALSNAQAIATAHLRYLFCGGEPLGSKLLAACRPLAEHVVNLYGPTEATIDATAWQANNDVVGSTAPIGRPIANTRIYLLDRLGQPVPLGAVGELYIGGAGVARGYLNRPDLTAERFLRDPFSPVADARMYRTGDLARYLPDGNLEFLGRNDHQVKLRGFRIELGEIEAQLSHHPFVREVTVLAADDRQGGKRLIAYVVATTDATEELATILRGHLAGRLPDYMVPAAFVRIEAMPLTPNGKLDRRALPAPDDDAYARQSYEAPQGDIEQAIADIWQELLGVERVGRHDHFFELGGHSLMAVQLISRLRSDYDIAVPLSSIFTSPCLDEFSEIVLISAISQSQKSETVES
jgi:amino acid adenylation domain-containing protein